MLPIKMSSLQKDPVMMSLFAVSVNKIAHPLPLHQLNQNVEAQIEAAINWRL